ncbi:hypothetical protein IFM61606_00076.1, partial [Aspergillus udagawae]
QSSQSSESGASSGYTPQSSESAQSAAQSGYKPQSSQAAAESGYKPEPESAPEHKSNDNLEAEHAPQPKPSFEPAPAQEYPETCVHGEILCGHDGQTWAKCDWGKPVQMGPVAAGTRCSHGVIERV